MSLVDVLLIATAFAFAWSMGAHYTGACMGMPYATGSIRLWPALLLMSALTFLGAAFLSHGVLATVGHHILTARLGTPAGIVIIGTAFLLTTLFNLLRIPTSTTQILIFSIAGVGAGLHLAIQWSTLARLVGLWAIVPPTALLLGYITTKLLDRVPSFKLGRHAANAHIAQALVVVGAMASLAMGASDVSKATGILLTTRFSGAWLAGLIGGIGLALGVLTWGRPLLEPVAFDVVRMDKNMAIAAQGVQAFVVLLAVACGYFTLMNQALVGATAGTGIARGHGTVRWPVVRGIFIGWLVGPAAAMDLGYAAARLLPYALRAA